MTCCSNKNGNSYKEQLKRAIKKSDQAVVTKLLEKCSKLDAHEISEMVGLADKSIDQKEKLERTLGEKIAMYLCGVMAGLYTFNLLAYSFSDYLQQKMFEAHGLSSSYIYPLAVILITLLGLLAFWGWSAPARRLRRALSIKKILETKSACN